MANEQAFWETTGYGVLLGAAITFLGQLGILGVQAFGRWRGKRAAAARFRLTEEIQGLATLLDALGSYSSHGFTWIDSLCREIRLHGDFEDGQIAEIPPHLFELKLRLAGQYQQVMAQVMKVSEDELREEVFEGVQRFVEAMHPTEGSTDLVADPTVIVSDFDEAVETLNVVISSVGRRYRTAVKSLAEAVRP